MTPEELEIKIRELLTDGWSLRHPIHGCSTPERRRLLGLRGPVLGPAVDPGEHDAKVAQNTIGQEAGIHRPPNALHWIIMEISKVSDDPAELAEIEDVLGRG